MTRLLSLSATVLLLGCIVAYAADPPAPPKVIVGSQAPAFKVKDPSGKEIDLDQLTAKGPVLLRLTCGCSGCDKELEYFLQIAQHV